jgi:hypothetical protein
MTKNIKLLIKISLLAALLVVDVFASGGKRNGTAGAPELLIPVGARGMALNGAYISGLQGIESIYYNPAGLGASGSSTEAYFSYMSWIADIGVSYAAIGTGFEGLGSIGLSIKSLSFGDIPETTVEAPYGTGATFSPTYVVLGLTYANALTDRIRIGVNFNYVSEKIMSSSASGISIDAGVQYNGIAEVEGLKLGVVLRNFGPSMSFDGPDLLRTATDPNSLRGSQFYKIEGASFELPSQLEFGLAYERMFAADYRMLLASSFQQNNFANDEYKLAAEFAFQETFFLRGGYSYMAEAVDIEEEQVFGPSFGAGVKVNAGFDLAVDYAYRVANYFDSNHVFALRITF